MMAEGMTAVGMIDTPDVTVVTGAGGWLGTGLVSAFLDPAHPWYRGRHLRLLVHDRDDEARLADVVRARRGRRRRHQRSCRRRSAVRPASSGTVDVIHTAGVIHPAAMTDFDAVNHVGTDNVLRAARGRIGHGAWCTCRRTARSAPTPTVATRSATTSRSTRISATAPRRCTPNCVSPTRWNEGSTS